MIYQDHSFLRLRIDEGAPVEAAEVSGAPNTLSKRFAILLFEDASTTEEISQLRSQEEMQSDPGSHGV